MKYLITLSCLCYVYAYNIAVNPYQMCSCRQVTYQPDCASMNSTCVWSAGACVSYNCTTITSQSTCTQASQCAWVNNSCQVFTQCSDYSSTSNTTCAMQGGGCNTSTTSNSTSGGFNCINPPSQSVAYCNTYTTSAACQNSNTCTWSNSACRVIACSDYPNSLFCQIALSSDFLTIKTCSWNGNACMESSTMNLNAQNCLAYSANMYTWNSNTNSCMSCSSSSTSIILIASLVALLV